MAETPNLGLYVTDINQASDAGMSVFKLLELLLGSGYVDKSNMEKIDEAISVIKDKLADYKSENVYITDHQKEGIENKQSEFNWTKNNQIEYFAKLLGGYEKGVLTVENTTITSDKSDILFTVTQGFSKLNNTATSGISEIQLAKSLLCERIMLDIKNDNDNIVYLTVYITVNGVQTTTQMTVPAKASVQKSFYNSIVRDLDSNSTIKFQAQTDGLPLIINSGSKAQYDYIDIDKISNLGDNFSDIIDNVYNELRSDLDDNLNRTTSLEANLYNPNLLINSNFKVAELVNQRGQTSYTTYGFQFDMWRFGGNVAFTTDLTGTYVKYTKNGTGVYRNIVQNIENQNVESGYYTQSALVKGTAGKTINLTILVDGVYKHMIYVCTGDWQLITNTVNVQNTLNGYTLQIQDVDEIEIQYMKLEKGQVATPFVDDDPATKLAKCQRYLQTIPANTYNRTSVLNTNNLYFNIVLSSNMRTIPAFVTSLAENVNFNVTSVVNGIPITGFSLSINAYSNFNLMLVATKNAHNLTDCSLYVKTNILLSAEL